jgi:hypothetical protein
MFTNSSFIWTQGFLPGSDPGARCSIFAMMQVLHGPRRCEGIGLRPWRDYGLRRFGRMTEEMRPSHRTDVLSGALEYYGIQTKKK